MRRFLVLIAVTVGLYAIVQSGHSQSQTTKQDSTAASPKQAAVKAKPAASPTAEDEQEIRANIEKFVKAYNAGDAKGVAALFTPDGEAWDKEGNESEGREAIAQTLSDLSHLDANAIRKHRRQKFLEIGRKIG